MKLLLDEHFSPKIARQLRRRHHDVVAAREQAGLHGLSDAELLAHATLERRALVTENVADFAELHRAAVISGRRHFGLIFTSPRRFPRTARAIGRLVRALDALLAAHRPDDALESQTWWLDPASRARAADRDVAAQQAQRHEGDHRPLVGEARSGQASTALIGPPSPPDYDSRA